MKIVLTKAWRGHKVGAEIEVDDAVGAKLIKANFANEVTPQPVSAEATVTPESAAPNTEATNAPSSSPDSDVDSAGPGDLVGPGQATVTDAGGEQPGGLPDVSAETVGDDGESKRMRRRREAYEQN